MSIAQARSLEIDELRRRAEDLEQSAEDYDCTRDHRLAELCRARAQVLREAILAISTGVTS